MPHGGPEEIQASVDKAVVHLYKVSLETRRHPVHKFSLFSATPCPPCEALLKEYTKFPLKMTQELL